MDRGIILAKIFEEQKGREIWVWAVGGNFYRGNYEGIVEGAFLIMKDASCPMAGERYEKDIVYIPIDKIEAIG